jgi:hypothetical protein
MCIIKVIRKYLQLKIKTKKMMILYLFLLYAMWPAHGSNPWSGKQSDRQVDIQTDTQASS